MSSGPKMARGIVTIGPEFRNANGLAMEGGPVARNVITRTAAHARVQRIEMKCRKIVQGALAGCLFLAGVLPAVAAQKAAVFPFDLRDAQQEGEVVPQLNPDDLKRLKLVADELKSLMEKSGNYEIVDLSSMAKEVDAASPFNKCNGCEADLAKKAGAEIAVTGFADKVSDALISLQVFARNAETGEMTKSMSAEVRGNTDELWLHGIRYLWRNRFNTEAKAP